MRATSSVLLLLLVGVGAWFWALRAPAADTVVDAASDTRVDARLPDAETARYRPLRVTGRVPVSPVERTTDTARSATIRVECAAPDLPPVNVVVRRAGSKPWRRPAPTTLQLPPGRYELELEMVDVLQSFWLQTKPRTVELRAGERRTVRLEAVFAGALGLFGAPSDTRQMFAVRGDLEIAVARTRGYRGPGVPDSNLIGPGWWRVEARDLDDRVLAAVRVFVVGGQTNRVDWPGRR